MLTYEFNDYVKFELPAGFIPIKEEDDQGNETVEICAGAYRDEEGHLKYNYACRLEYHVHDPEDADGKSENLLFAVAENFGETNRVKLRGEPETVLLNKTMTFSFGDSVIKSQTLVGLIHTTKWGVAQLIVPSIFNDDNPAYNSSWYEFFLEMLKAVRINEAELPLSKITPVSLEEAIPPIFEDSGISFNISTSCNVTSNVREQFTRAFPSEDLYPHYGSIPASGPSSLPGVTFIVNSKGTEYRFIPLRELCYDDIQKSALAVCKKAIEMDTENYSLYEKAKEMQRLFHVNKSAFDPERDRECEIEKGYIHRAYMVHALRSFAWTLADYCKQHQCAPEDIDSTTASKIAKFVADEGWLNYDGNTYCQGLCSGSDLHTYFLPDSVPQSDKEYLLPLEEDLDRVKQMKARFPSYCEILTEVHSLDALRKDLKYIYPTVKTLWINLAEDRDYEDALLGNEADIVYAWCAFAIAAREPFFTEDGPMSCYFTQIDDQRNSFNLNACTATAEFAEATPNEELYPYYKVMLTNGEVNLIPSQYVFNFRSLDTPGQDYMFFPISSFEDVEELSDEDYEMYERILALDVEDYDLHKKAKDMMMLFCVKSAVFNPQHDRAKEIDYGNIYKVYMLSALRSFAWTLAEYCKRNDCIPSDVSYNILSKIVDFVAGKNWLNYDGTSYCMGLCSTRDLFVCYFPDNVTQKDKNEFFDIGDIVSLSALRKDLRYIYPAIKTLWEHMAIGRDYNKELTGNEADIVYAWCSLANAAKEPFQLSEMRFVASDFRPLRNPACD